MNIQAPAVMPRWDALTEQEKQDLKDFEDKIMNDAMAHAQKVGGWVTIYWDGNDVNYEKGTVIGQANGMHGNLNDLRKHYTKKFLC